MNNNILIDIGGTTIIGALFNKNEKKIIKTVNLKVGEYSNKNIINKIDEIIKEFENEEYEYIGISLNGLISNNSYVHLSRPMGGDVGKNLAEILSKKYSKIVKIENDVNCMALGYKYLKNKKNNFLLLNIGTGVRISYIYNNELLRGENGFFGEIKDEIFVEELKQVINLNDLVCGRGISNIYKILYKEEKTAKEIFELNLENNKKTEKTIKIFIKYLVYLLLRTTYSYNPREIIIDGSLKIIFSYYKEKILKKYEKKCDKNFVAKITISDFDNTAIYGALFI